MITFSFLTSESFIWYILLASLSVLVNPLLMSPTVFMTLEQEVTKRCRLSWLTNSALVSEPKCGER